MNLHFELVDISGMDENFQFGGRFLTISVCTSPLIGITRQSCSALDAVLSTHSLHLGHGNCLKLDSPDVLFQDARKVSEETNPELNFDTEFPPKLKVEWPGRSEEIPRQPAPFTNDNRGEWVFHWMILGVP